MLNPIYVYKYPQGQVKNEFKAVKPRSFDVFNLPAYYVFSSVAL